ncbi:MAG: PhzF family phenazine biosynthesis protein [Emticicia sp.]
MVLNFSIVDVFAEEKYQGNQLAVFENVGDLSDEMMFKIAREINFQETTFIISDEEKNGGFDVRIFTPEYEVPFAGHPTLGTAFVLLNSTQNTDKQSITLNLKIGQIPINKENETLWLEINKPIFGKKFGSEIVNLFGLKPEDIDETYPIEIVSTGLPYLILPLKNLDAIRRIRFNDEQVKSWLLAHHLYKTNAPDELTTAFFAFTRETEKAENQLHARMFCYENEKIVEDAATGSANSCLLAYLLKYESTKINYRVEQGYEMERPSLIQINGVVNEQQGFSLKVGGKTKLVAQGKWFV